MRVIYTFLCCFLTAITAGSQSVWMANTGAPNTEEWVTTSRMTSTGDVISCGFRRTGADHYITRLTKHDGAAGFELWMREYQPTYKQWPQDLVIAPQGFYLGGYSSAVQSPTGHREAMVAGFNSSGDSLFFKSYTLDTGQSAFIRDIDLAGNGLIMGGILGNFTTPGKLFLMKTDWNGDTLWTAITDLGGYAVNHFMGVEQMGDKYYVATSFGTIGNSSNNIAISIFDTLGNYINSVYEYSLGTINSYYNGDAFRKISGNRLLLASNIPVIGGSGSHSIFDHTGTLVQTFNHPGMVAGLATAEAPSNGDFLLLGTVQGLDSIIFDRYTPAGNLVFHRGYAKPAQMVNTNYMGSMEPTADGGFLISGYFSDMFTFGSADGWIIKTDSMGRVSTNNIEGTVFADFNGNCVQDPGEFPIPGVAVLMMPDSIYQFTDSLGRYSYEAYSGSYTVYPPNLYNVWSQVCPISGVHSVTFPLNNYTIDSLNHFGFESSITDCGLMQVDLAVSSFRVCLDRPGSIFYNNIGTDTAHNAKIVLDLDPALSLTSASLPYTQSGNQYTFNLGNVLPFQTGTIQLLIFTDCNASPGVTTCISATAYPDTNCIAPGPNYDQSLIEAQGYCVNDTVKFAVRNVGTGNMTTARNLTIYEDNIIFMTVPYIINAGDSSVIAIPTNGGKSYFLHTIQHPDYPRLTQPIAFVEGCGTPQYSLGVIPRFPLYDLDPYYDLECETILNSYDPNDKTGYPLGFLAPNYITANDPLEYKIRFQNTGNDTCYLVVIRDTISSFMNLASFQPGASSHPYTVTMGANREVVFRFEHINLPDSTTNEQESMGFVNFAIRQEAGNTPGTQIKNTSYIFFDFNEPVITNTTLHTIELPSVFHPLEVIPATQNLQVTISPNPSTSWIRISSEAWKEGWEFSLWSMDGKFIMKKPVSGPEQLINMESLAPGTYLYSLEDGTGGFSKGKIIKL